VRELLLGLDVGTTATKALLLDRSGDEVASASCGYGLITPQDGWVEQEPEELWRGVVTACRSVQARAGISGRAGDPGRIVAIGLSSQGGTTIPVGASGLPIHNAFSWMDQRAHEQGRRMREQVGAEFVYRTTGWRLGSGLPLQHIAWLREHRAEVFSATRQFLFVNDFVTQRLTGRQCTNPSDAGITQLLNLDTGDWDRRLLELAGVRLEQLSPVRPSGYPVGRLTVEASAATGLPQDALVVNGAHDQYCAAVGAGVMLPGQVLLSCGTAWVILAVPESKEVGLECGMGVSHHAIGARWGALRSMAGVGTSLDWFLENAWGGKVGGEGRTNLYEAANRAVAQSPPGARGIHFFPLSGGHGVAHGRSSGGGFVGLSLAHSREDMTRAVMEGIALELRWLLQEMDQSGLHVAELTMVGGAAESPVWPQIVADASGIPVALPSSKQAASRGAAILAGVGAGIFADAEAGFAAFGGQESRLEPIARHRDVYDDAFRGYQELYDLLAYRREGA
jgi:sugar (pentulose or hexulose) kinase